MKINLESPFAIELNRQFAPAAPISKQSKSSAGFGDALSSALNKVEQSALSADHASEDLISGKIDIHEAMVSMEKADLMLKMGSTIRVKLLDAYQKLLSSGS